ncbi:MAG: dTMP kinase [Elusimicrobiota bacterium]
MTKKSGFFITLEGCEGSGKSTHSAILAAALKRGGRKIVHTREPGGTTLAEAVRKILLHPKSRISPLAELFLYEAARAQHIAEVMGPALDSGKTIVCDRFFDATVAYQGYGRGIGLDIIRELNRVASCGIIPDLTIYLDIPAGKGLKKAKKVKKGADRLEMETVSFHNRVRKGYLALARREPKRIKIIKVQKTVSETAKLILREVDKVI